MTDVHQLCVLIRNLRLAAGWTLVRAAEVTGLSPIVLGSYERGDRTPPLAKIEQVLNAYGYDLIALPSHQPVVRLPTDMAEELRTIATILENRIPEKKMVPLSR